MTPQEHYDRAEELAVAVERQINVIADQGNSFDVPEMTAFTQNLIMMVGRVTMHAKLAEVGLLLQRDEEAPYAYDSNKDHDFPMSAPKITAFCQKCGRCWDHQGAECAGGQEHSTAKACLVCVGVGGR